MTKFLKTVAALPIALAAATAAHAAPLSTWYGEFAYEHPLGRIGGTPGVDSPMAFVTYHLSLGPQAGATGCMLRIEGFQTFERHQCTATPQEESAIIKFYRFGDKGSPRWYSGQPLLTLTRTEAGVMTRWQGIAPEGGRQGGFQFRRVG